MWRCQYCETFNKDENMVCEVCGNSKGSQAGMPKTASADPHVIMTQQPDAGFTGSGSAPVYGSGSAPVRGSGSAPVYGSGSAPVHGSGSAPVYGSGSTPVHGSGSAPVYGSGSAPVHGSGSAPVYGSGSAPVHGSGSAPVYGSGSAPVHGSGSAPVYGSGSAPVSGAAPAAETSEPVNGKKRKKGTWAIWLIVILILLVIAGTVSWVMFEEEIRTFISDITGNEAETENEDEDGDDAAESTSVVGSGLFGNVTEEAAPSFSGAQYVNAESSAEDIAYVQDMLQKLGFLAAGSFTTGEYDEATVSAVRSFQQKVNADSGYVALSETGECDAATLVYFAQYNANAAAMPASDASVPNILSAVFSKETAIAGETVELSITTDASAATLKLYDQEGIELGTWNADEASSADNDVRVWKIQRSVDAVGNHSFTVIVTADNINYSPTYTASVNVISIDVTDAYFDAETVIAGQNRTLTAITPAEAVYLYMYSSTSERKYEWAAEGNSVLDGANRIWNVACNFTDPGTYDYTFVASNDAVTTGNGITKAITVYQVPPVIHSVVFGSYYFINNADVALYAETEAHATALLLYDANGEYISSWDANTYSVVENGVRKWNMTLQFAQPNSYSLNFFATADDVNVSEPVPADVTVFSLDISSVYYDADSVVAGQSRLVTATSPAEAMYLYMYDSYGNRIGEWAAEGNSYVDGANRVWTVAYIFNDAGTYDYTFFASNDTVTIGNGMAATITVLPPPPSVHSASVGKTVGLQYEELIITATTDSHAHTLLIYNENGEYVNSWDAATYSYEENGLRVWNVPQSFDAIGDRYMMLGATSDGIDIGGTCGIAVTILNVDVYYVAFDSTTVTAGQQHMITAHTPIEAQFLLMHDLEGVEKRRWEAIEYSSIDEETGTRMWNVPCTFTVEGVYDYVINASYDGTAYGAGIPTSITILPKN